MEETSLSRQLRFLRGNVGPAAVRGTYRERKWALLIQELVERSKLIREVADDKPDSFQRVLREGVELAEALGFEGEGCLQAVRKILEDSR